MKKLKAITLIILCFIILGIHTITLADVGSFDRYDSGGSDWGSSSSSWSSSSSSWDSDYDYDADGFILGLLLGNSSGGWGIIIIIVIVILAGKFKGKYRPRRQQYYPSAQPTTTDISANQSHECAKQIQQIDPNFSEEKMLEWAKDLFVKLQNAWTARDWEPMRPFETERLFEQHKNQVQGYIDTNRINVMDRIAVNYAYLYNFRQEGDRDILDIALKSTMKDYIINADTKELLEGSKTQDRSTLYRMTFERKTGVITEERNRQY